MNKYDDTDYLIEREESIEYEEDKNKNEINIETLGQRIDELINEIAEQFVKNPEGALIKIAEINEEKDKEISNLKVKLKNKQSEIDFLKGQLAVYEKFLNLEDLKDERYRTYRHKCR